VDFSAELIGTATDLGSSVANLKFFQGDWFSMSSEAFDRVISLQTLSWLPEFETPLEQIFTKIKPKWIAATSLLYEGDISCRTINSIPAKVS
jgi:trans-aconitate methyltransferase